MMVNLNVWFIPRSRSTALTRAISNIPGTQIFYENFLATYFTEKTDQHATDSDVRAAYDSIMEAYRKDTSPHRVVKDFPMTVGKEFLTEIVTRDSVNVFLTRDPALVATSKLPKTGQLFYDISRAVNKFSLEYVYQEMLQVLNYVLETCEKSPLILSGEKKFAKFFVSFLYLVGRFFFPGVNNLHVTCIGLRAVGYVQW